LKKPLGYKRVPPLGFKGGIYDGFEKFLGGIEVTSIGAGIYISTHIYRGERMLYRTYVRKP